MRKTLCLAAIATLAALSCASGVTAQPQSGKCSSVKYSKPETGAVRYRLNRIEGQAVLALVAQKWEAQSVGGLCVALFDEQRGKLVASVTTNQKGQFAFANIPPGKYTLIAFLDEDELQRVVIPVQLYKDSRSAGKPQRLLLHMRLREDSRASFATPVANPALRLELLAMYEQDQAIRNKQIEEGADKPDEALLRRMNEIDSANTARMRVIVKKYGWPGPELVGIDGTEAAFTIVQHAEHTFQREMLPLVEKAYRANKLSGQSYALLFDRVLVENGQPQVYGTQARRFTEWNGHEPVLYPIKDEANVDKRRAEVGLEPLAEYLKFLKRMYFPNDKDK